MDHIGCSDGACIFGPPEGQHTNGGCHCLEGMRSGTERARLREKIVALRERAEALQKENDALKAQFKATGHVPYLDRINELIARVEAAEWERDDYKTALEGMRQSAESWKECNHRAEAERDALKAEVEWLTKEIKEICQEAREHNSSDCNCDECDFSRWVMNRCASALCFGDREGRVDANET